MAEQYDSRLHLLVYRIQVMHTGKGSLRGLHQVAACTLSAATPWNRSHASARTAVLSSNHIKQIRCEELIKFKNKHQNNIIILETEWLLLPFATLLLCTRSCNLVPDVTFLSLSEFSMTLQRSLAAI